MNINDNSNNIWDTKIMLLLKKYAETSLSYNWMHENEYKYYTSLEKIYTRIDIVLTAILTIFTSGGLFELFTNYFFGSEPKLWVIFTLFSIQIVFLIISFIIKGIMESIDFTEIKFQHNLYAFRFKEVYTKVEKKLATNDDDKKIFLDKIVSKYNDLTFDAPSIRKDTENKYLKELKNKNLNIHKPISLGGLDEIEIILDNKNGNRIHIKDDSLYEYIKNKWNNSNNDINDEFIDNKIKLNDNNNLNKINDFNKYNDVNNDDININEHISLY